MILEKINEIISNIKPINTIVNLIMDKIVPQVDAKAMNCSGYTYDNVTYVIKACGTCPNNRMKVTPTYWYKDSLICMGDPYCSPCGVNP